MRGSTAVITGLLELQPRLKHQMLPELTTWGTTSSFLSSAPHFGQERTHKLPLQSISSDGVASLLLPRTGAGCWPVCVCEHLATVRGRDTSAHACWLHSRYVDMTLSLLIEEEKMERTNLRKRHGFGRRHKSRRSGPHACFPFPRPKENGFKSLTLSAVLSPLLHTVSLILVFIDGCANTDILWFLNSADGCMTLKSISCGSFIFLALDTICPLC